MATAGTGRTARSPPRLAAGLALVLFGALLSSGCLTVTLYQPQKAIHRPVVITRAPSNFEGLRILVRCYARDDHMTPQEASKLCSTVADDLLNQGAESEWVVPVGAQWVQPEVFEGAKPDFTVDIVSKIDHEYSYPLTLVASVITLTIIPSVREWTYSQQVRVLGRDNSVLTEELFRERFVEYHGIGIYSLNWILDWTVRDDHEELMSDNDRRKEFSADFLGQIRQLTFNARIRSEILGLTAPPGRRSPLVVDESEGDGREEGEGAGAAGSGADIPMAPASPPPLPGLEDDPVSDEGGP